MRTEIYIGSGDADENKDFFDELHADQEAIEAEFGAGLKWERLDNKKSSRIAIYRPGSIEDSSEDLQEIHKWGIQNLLRFKKVFGKKGSNPPHPNTSINRSISS